MVSVAGRLLMAAAVFGGDIWVVAREAIIVLVKLTREYQLTNGMVNIVLRTCVNVHVCVWTSGGAFDATTPTATVFRVCVCVCLRVSVHTRHCYILLSTGASLMKSLRVVVAG